MTLIRISIDSHAICKFIFFFMTSSPKRIRSSDSKNIIFSTPHPIDHKFYLTQPPDFPDILHIHGNWFTLIFAACGPIVVGEFALRRSRALASTNFGNIRIWLKAICHFSRSTYPKEYFVSIFVRSNASRALKGFSCHSKVSSFVWRKMKIDFLSGLSTCF